MSRQRTIARALALLALIAAPGACGSPQQPQPPPPPDPSLATLDRLISRRQPAAGSGQAADHERCLARARSVADCPSAPSRQHTLPLRLVLDRRYLTQWGRWEARLHQVLGCVNRLYRPTGVRWDLRDILQWDPGARRHQLHGLLTRLQREFPADGQTLLVGITVWEQRKIYALSGGEIGLSQGGACVVPSWPRPENDCIILAHELGHLIGARHVPGKRWVMGWAARPFHLPAADPIARVLSSYSFHPRNLEVIGLHQRASLTRRGLQLIPGCQARVRRLDRCWGLSR